MATSLPINCEPACKQVIGHVAKSHRPGSGEDEALVMPPRAELKDLQAPRSAMRPAEGVDAPARQCAVDLAGEDWRCQRMRPRNKQR